MKPKITLDVQEFNRKTYFLQKVSEQLKKEFFGLDITIDRVISSIKAWYIFPQIIQRPVIVNLWGLTGVGKTQLVRRLVHLLEMGDKFVEIQMDGGTSSSANYDTTIASLLTESSIEEGKPGILLLDEFQRYRTINESGEDVKVERFQDVWMLLSDGQFSSDASLFQELEMMIAMHFYESSQKEDEDDEEGKVSTRLKRKKKRTGNSSLMFPYEAKSLKNRLKLDESLHEIMTWDTRTIQAKIEECRAERAGRQIDYTKLLIFVSGNLDEAYRMAENVENCDTDADVFYEMSKRISVTEIKKALATRFKPEQIARFGNNHIIYTSLSKDTYQKLIHASCYSYMREMENVTGISFSLTPESEQVIYDNAVYPSQGTRPVFSSVHKIFTDALVQFAFWGVQKSLTKIDLHLDGETSKIYGKSNATTNTLSVPVDLDISAKRKKATIDFNTLVAVHEAGHALVYALLTKCAPKDIKINTASYEGGYTTPSDDNKTHSRAQIQRMLAVFFAGTCAERLVFGTEIISSGCASDIERATADAAAYVREYGMDDYHGLISTETSIDPSGRAKMLTFATETDPTIKRVLGDAFDNATDLLCRNKVLYRRLVNRLLNGIPIQQEEFISLFPELELNEFEMDENYSDKWKEFNI